MNLYEVLQDSLYDSLESIFNRLGYVDGQDIQIVFDSQNALEPTNTYCLVHILDTERIGRVHESTFLTWDEEEMWYTNFYTLFVQLSIIGNKANEIIINFTDSVFSSRLCIEDWQKNSLGPIKQSKTRRIPQPRESGWTDSHNLDLTLSYAVQSREVMDWVEFFKCTYVPIPYEDNE